MRPKWRTWLHPIKSFQKAGVDVISTLPMIFSSVRTYIEREGAFRVVIDLAIALTLIFTALQVLNWMIERHQTEQLQIQTEHLHTQLDQFAEELEVNLKRLEAYRRSVEARAESISTLQKISPGVNSDKRAEIEVHMKKLLERPTYDPELSVFEALKRPKNFDRVVDIQINKAMSQWEKDLRAVERLSQASRSSKDGNLLFHLLEAASMGADIPENLDIPSDDFLDAQMQIFARSIRSIEVLDRSTRTLLTTIETET